MQNSVLTLGEKIVLAARLASIEHVRQELDAARQRESARDASKREVAPVGDRSSGGTDAAEADAFTRPVPLILGDVFRRLELTTPMPARPARPAVARTRTRGAA